MLLENQERLSFDKISKSLNSSSDSYFSPLKIYKTLAFYSKSKVDENRPYLEITDSLQCRQLMTRIEDYFEVHSSKTPKHTDYKWQNSIKEEIDSK